jgi:hypothetical protein
MMRSIAATLCLLALEACVHEQVLEPAVQNHGWKPLRASYQFPFQTLLGTAR